MCRNPKELAYHLFRVFHYDFVKKKDIIVKDYRLDIVKQIDYLKVCIDTLDNEIYYIFERELNA